LTGLRTLIVFLSFACITITLLTKQCSLFLSFSTNISHANMMDDLLGAMLDIDDSVAEIMAWIDANGGYEKNALYVTADHDHYLTLLPRK
jgi:hypothetical protein